MIHTSCLRNVRLGRHHYATTCSCQMAVQTDIILLHFWFRAVSPSSIRRAVCRIADAIIGPSRAPRSQAVATERSMCSDNWPLNMSMSASSDVDTPFAFCEMYKDSLVASLAKKSNQTSCFSS